MTLTKLRVHVAPVGYEIDRVVISAKQEKADKVWLLVHDNPSADKALPYVEKIKSELKKLKIKTEIARADRLNLFQILRAVREIVEEEKDNDIYVNVASGSKIQAIACMMACMIFNDRGNVYPFYAEAEKWSGFEGKQQSYGVKDVHALPTYKIQTPRKNLVSALKIIKDAGGKIGKKQLAILAEENKLIEINAENAKQARFASLDANIIRPLETKWKFIEVEKIGNTRYVKITKEGLNATEFLV